VGKKAPPLTTHTTPSVYIENTLTAPGSGHPPTLVTGPESFACTQSKENTVAEGAVAKTPSLFSFGA
jgi:hypothetical protein